MGAFNTLKASTLCPQCKTLVPLKFQFKFGDTWQYEYVIGDILSWGGNDYGKSGLSEVMVQAFSEECPNCKSESEYIIHVESDVLIGVFPNSGENSILFGINGYVIRSRKEKLTSE
jgi:phage FluMu protein Com